jgi:hypothetical protein
MCSKTQTKKGQLGLYVRTTILRSQVTDAMAGLAPVQAQQRIVERLEERPRELLAFGIRRRGSRHEP